MTLKILYCENEVDLVELVKVQLELSFPKCEITHFDNASEAMSLLQSFGDNAFDVILSDNDMPPGPSGVDLFRYVKEQGLYIPFVLYSGSLNEDLVPEGAFFFSKPYEIETLKKTINKAINHGKY